MSPQRYERVSDDDHDETPMTPTSPQDQQHTPSSPPPSFRSRTSSPSSRRLLSSEDPVTTDAERTLNDTFDDGSDSDDEGNNGGDDRQRLMRSANTQSQTSSRTTQEIGRPDIQRNATRFPGHVPVPDQAITRPVVGTTPHNAHARLNDGVFANLNAKPERGEKLEEQPPSYEDAAADATPPYWEPNTIFAPGNLSSSDEVYVDGLPVGSLFSFVWNGMISVSFQLVGFLLTYLLHTTHAAKNGSRAGLGITLVQYGFYMRAGAHKSTSPTSDGSDPAFAAPEDPNSHDFDPNSMQDGASGAAAAAMSGSDTVSSGSSGSTDWIAYAVMIIGWFILIRAVSDFIKARKHEQLVLQSPDRGLNVPVVADNERPETAV